MECRFQLHPWVSDCCRDASKSKKTLAVDHHGGPKQVLDVPIEAVIEKLLVIHQHWKCGYESSWPKRENDRS